MATSSSDGYSSDGPDADPTQLFLKRLILHIAALESELAEYASRYGLTDRARELLANPVVD